MTPDEGDLRRQLARAFHEAVDVEELDHLRDTFASRITGIICAGGEQTLMEFSELIGKTAISCEVKGIALEVIGSMWHPASLRKRRLLLEQNLGASDATIRTSAVLGISNLSSPFSLPSLQEAFNAEKDDALRSTIHSTIQQLKELSP